MKVLMDRRTLRTNIRGGIMVTDLLLPRMMQLALALIMSRRLAYYNDNDVAR